MKTIGAGTSVDDAVDLKWLKCFAIWCAPFTCGLSFKPYNRKARDLAATVRTEVKVARESNAKALHERLVSGPAGMTLADEPTEFGAPVAATVEDIRLARLARFEATQRRKTGTTAVVEVVPDAMARE